MRACGRKPRRRPLPRVFSSKPAPLRTTAHFTAGAVRSPDASPLRSRSDRRERLLLCSVGLAACGGGGNVSDAVPKSTPEITPPTDTSAEKAAVQTTSTSTTSTTLNRAKVPRARRAKNLRPAKKPRRAAATKAARPKAVAPPGAPPPKKRRKAAARNRPPKPAANPPQPPAAAPAPALGRRWPARSDAASVVCIAHSLTRRR